MSSGFTRTANSQHDGDGEVRTSNRSVESRPESGRSIPLGPSPEIERFLRSEWYRPTSSAHLHSTSARLSSHEHFVAGPALPTANNAPSRTSRAFSAESSTPGFVQRPTEGAFQPFLPASFNARIDPSIPNFAPTPLNLRLARNPSPSRLDQFIDGWLRYSRISDDSTALRINDLARDMCNGQRMPHIKAEDVKGDDFDLQGINWTRIGTTRAKARSMRTHSLLAMRRFEQRLPAAAAEKLNPVWKDAPSSTLHDAFCFRRMNTGPLMQPGYHRQLRHLLAVTSHNDIYYATRAKVQVTDPLGYRPQIVMDLEPGALRRNNGQTEFAITSLDASPDVVIAGSGCGEYALASLNDSDGALPYVGNVIKDRKGAICHVDIHARRSQGHRPLSAAFSSNDKAVRILDIPANKFVAQFQYDSPINATAVDPHARMRMVVGDSNRTLVTAAETGQTLVQLEHHSLRQLSHHSVRFNEGVFGVSWSKKDGGRYVATAAEDRRVVIYDARNWKTPVAGIACPVSCARSLQFSPDGNWLLMAMAEDFVAVVDAGDGLFERAQTTDFFGSVVGARWRPDGGAFWVANQDENWGGLMEFEMRHDGIRSSFEDEGRRAARQRKSSKFALGNDDEDEDNEDMSDDGESDDDRPESSRMQQSRRLGSRKGLNLGKIRF